MEDQALTDTDIKKILDWFNDGGEETGEESNAFKQTLAEVREKFRKQGLYFYFDPNANDLEGEWKVTPLDEAL